jgi:hypothetical protein
VSTPTAFALAVEVGDWDRFTGKTIGAYIGPVPSEHSSGTSRVQGSITRAGKSHLRRLLIEAAWHHRPRYIPGVTLRARWEQAPPQARARGDLGNRRLHHRWVGFDTRPKKATIANTAIANTAIARELARWCRSLATLE